MNAMDLSAYRARKEAAERDYAEKKSLEMATSAESLAELIAGLREMSARPVDERAAEMARREERRERLRSAGVPTPRAGTDQGSAWDRVVKATCPADAARPGHAGSAKAMAAVEWWQAPAGRSRSTMILVGDRGVGKTVAGWFALANAGGVYVSAGDIAPTPRWDELRGRAIRAGLLVINDLHERMIPWAWAAIADVLIERHDVGKRTLVTTNLDRARLVSAEHLTARTESRIGDRKTGQGLVVTIEGADIRSMVSR